MGLFDIFRRTENRADGFVEVEASLLQALTGRAEVTREMALQVPTVSGGIDLIANIIAGTPIVLYREKDGKAEPVKGDRRVFLLNDEPEENMDANQWWHAMIRDYFLGRGGYAWIEKSRGEIKALHYVRCEDVSIIRREDPLRKDFDIQVAGQTFQPMHFLRLLRNTRDGAEGCPITKENSQLIAVANQALKMELAMSKRGGNKKGFLKSEKPLTREAMDELKDAWRDLYSTGENSAMVLNKGLDFMEVSETSVEMQLNENKKANANEFAKLFHISPETASGKAQDLEGLAKLAAIPVMKAIECALNRDILREKEKGTFYWGFDTKELLKGSMKDRFDAYRTALEANFMQIDEVRFAEDLEPLGLNWIRLGLQDVLYDPKTNTVYTPNTNRTAVMGKTQLPGTETLSVTAEGGDISLKGEGKDVGNGGPSGTPAPTGGSEEKPPLQERAEIELRENPNHDPTNGQFTFASGSAGAASGNSDLTSGGSDGTLQSSSKPSWSKEEQKKPFDYYEMQPDKTGYPRHLKAKGFSSAEREKRHYEDHGKSVGATDSADYVAKAKAFFESPRGKNGDAVVKKNGDACRYDYGTHEFMAVTKTGVIKTYWNLLDGRSPTSADNYWEDQKKE